MQAAGELAPMLFPAQGAESVSNRTNRRSKPKNDHLHESIAVYLKMQTAETEEEFQQLLAEHDRLTDADDKPRLAHRALRSFRPIFCPERSEPK
jgi:hypothetical protein